MSFESVMPPYNASDPNASFLSASCLDFLLIELVPMAYRITNEVDAAALEGSSTATAEPPSVLSQSNNNDGGSAGNNQAQNSISISSSSAAAATRLGGAGTGIGISSGRTTTATTMDEDEERDAVFYRLETLGYRVGQGLVERFSRDRPRFNDTLDVIKFLCKDLWTLVFRKQVDNLKTNHRVCVFLLLFSSSFPLCSSVSSVSLSLYCFLVF